MPTDKKDQYMKRDGDLELKNGINQYSRRKDVSGKTVGGLSVMFMAIKKTLSSLKVKYPMQKLHFQSSRFVKDLSVSATLIKDDKASKNQSKEYIATESTKTLVNFFTLLRKAIGTEVDDNTTDLVTTTKKEIYKRDLPHRSSYVDSC